MYDRNKKLLKRFIELCISTIIIRHAQLENNAVHHVIRDFVGI